MEYRGFYKQYDMSGSITIGSGIVKVHDIFDPIPKFMIDADCIFVDPPCSEGNLKSFYTKADLEKRAGIEKFTVRLFEVISEINPNKIFFEVFKSNRELVKQSLQNLGYLIIEHESYYYGKESNKCWIIQAIKDDALHSFIELPYLDEEKIVEYICKNVKFEVIADPCMGKGLAGFYANKYNKRFVGTELNKKRLACLIEHINRGKIIVR